MASDLRWVATAVRRPHRCAAIPFIGMNHAGGYIDTGTEYEGERVYISVAAVCEMAKMIGWCSPAGRDEMTRARDALQARVDELERELDSKTRALDAIDALESHDYRVRRKPGRPRTDAKEPVA